MAVSKVDAANQIENQLPQANIANNVNFRNYLINGDMSIAQRSTSVASITTGGYKTIDRFNTQISSLGTWTQSQSTTVPSGQGFTSSLKMDCTVADASPAAGDYLIIDQRIEAQNLQNLSYGTSSAKQLTLSFWVRSNKTGTYNIWLYQPDDARSFSKQYTINTADTWEKKEITWAGDTTGVIDNNNGDGLRVGFYLGAGTDSTSGTLPTAWESDTQANRAVGQVNLADSADNEWFLTGLQLEAGDTTSDFEFLPHDVNKNKCLRYYNDYGGNNPRSFNFDGQYANGAGAGVGDSYTFNVPMRAAPTATFSYTDLTNASGVSVSDDTIGAFIEASATTSGRIAARFGASGYIRFDAEL